MSEQKETAKCERPSPGEVWKPTLPGSGKRTVVAQRVNSKGDAVSYRTPSGSIRRIDLSRWIEWVDTFRCELS